MIGCVVFEAAHVTEQPRASPSNSFVMNPSAKRRIPNVAIAGALALAAVGSYYYTLHAVGTTDIDAEVQKVLDSQKQSKN